MIRVLSILGTRPEAIKMAPVVHELTKYPNHIESLLCITAQHREMLDQVLVLFAIKPTIDLNLMRNNQGLDSLTARAVIAITEVLKRLNPNLVLVQGDTSTAMVATLAAFYHKVPVGHIEAGLRTGSRYNPFPEEMNRRIISVLATYHFAPTSTAAKALRNEGIPDENIFITGNTVIDALLYVSKKSPSEVACSVLRRIGIREIRNRCQKGFYDFSTTANRPQSFQSGLRTILVTAHRRENFGQPLQNICLALRRIAERNIDVQIVYPVHLNPNVQESVRRMLKGCDRLHLIEPLSYEPFVHLMKHAYLVLTDSGGIQEEAPALGKPVLVMRNETERPEAVDAGTVKLVGTNVKQIVSETERLLLDQAAYDKMAHAVSPYGDGHAAQRIARIIKVTT